MNHHVIRTIAKPLGLALRLPRRIDVRFLVEACPRTNAQSPPLLFDCDSAVCLGFYAGARRGYIRGTRQKTAFPAMICFNTILIR
jgi:hypothetical protein